MEHNNQNGSKALTAGTWYVISSIIVKAIGFISMPIFTRMMTKAEYGTSQTFLSWYALLITFCTLNLTYSVGRAKLDFPDRLDEYIGSVQLLAAIVSMIYIFIGIIFIHPISSMLGINEALTVLLMLYLFFTPAIDFAQNGYRYRYRYKENIAIAWFISFGSVLLSLFLMLTINKDKALLRVIGTVTPNVIVSLFFWTRAIKRKEISYNSVFWSYGLKISLPLILHTVCMNILSQSDRVFILKICGNEEAGIYSLVYGYGILISVITHAISNGWLPWFHDNYFAGNYKTIRTNSKKMVLFGCYLGLACIALAPEAILLLGGSGYLSGLYCVPPVVLGITCQYIYTHYVNIELHLKKTIFVSYGTIFAAFLNIILNSIFIPKYGMVAASYTTLISYMVLMLVHFLITRVLLNVRLYDDIFMFGILALTFAIAIILEMVYKTKIVRYGLIIIGFCSFLYFFKNEIYHWLNKRNFRA